MENPDSNTRKSNESSNYLSLVRELPLHEITVAGKKWSYLTTGLGEKTILFIRGLGVNCDIWWQQMAVFDMAYKVISISYPDEPDNGNLADAINLILSKERALKVLIVANSYGGCLAQWFAARYPGRVAGLVLANTYLPSPEVLGKYSRFFKLIKWAPNWLAVKVFSKINAEAIQANGRHEAMALYQRGSGLRTLTKQEFIAVIAALTNAPEFKSDLLKAIPTLIINAADDTILEMDSQLKLRNSYLWAHTVTYEKGGHFPYLVNAIEFNKTVNQFLSSIQ